MKHVTFHIPDTRICFQCGAVAGRCNHTPAYPTTREVSVGPSNDTHSRLYKPLKPEPNKGRVTYRPTQFKWTEEVQMDVELLWRTNWTAGQIADRIGASRNAVLGKLRRMGLTGKQGVAA